MFRKLLIANRGEIACRVIRTAQQLGIRTVAVYSDADSTALHVEMADEAVHIGGPAPSDSYLRAEAVIEAARQTGADAIHPGYGFLSENASFSEACRNEGIAFIGPPAEAIRVMGSKSAAKQAMEQAGVPLLPGYHGDDQDPEILQKAAGEIGYPVLLKAVAGGGGKGMRQVGSDREFREALEAAKREARSGFGNDAMLVEKYLLQPRHVEVQVFFDRHGNGVYLFERDCSVQRRHQKIIEEAPAPGLNDETRQAMGEAAVRAAKAVGYEGAGTVEFLLDAGGEFFFMEMNTRLQVEHPVTEMITGHDLVAWQLKVANNEPLPCTQEELCINGHAFEARIYAEDPDREFLPAAGRLTWLHQPTESQFVRVDSGVRNGDEVGVYYDPMIAKLIVHGSDRAEALDRLLRALADYQVSGVTNNIAFLQRVAAMPDFMAANLSTDFIDRHHDDLFMNTTPGADKVLPLALLYLTLKQQQPGTADSPWDARDQWRLNGVSRQRRTIVADGNLADCSITRLNESSWSIDTGESTHIASGNLSGNELTATVDGHQQKLTIITSGDSYDLFMDGNRFTFSEQSPDMGEEVFHDDGTGFNAPMNGTLVNVLVAAGDEVEAGDTLLIMEAMKMEHPIKAPCRGTVSEIFFSKGDLVDGGAQLIAFQAME